MKFALAAILTATLALAGGAPAAAQTTIFSGSKGTGIFGDGDNQIDAGDETLFAFYLLVFADMQVNSPAIGVALDFLNTAYSDYQNAYFFAFSNSFFFTFYDFSFVQTDLANAALILFQGTYTSSGTDSPLIAVAGVQQSGQLIDQAAFFNAVANVNSVPGWAANPGTSNQYAWWALWEILYAYDDINTMNKIVTGGP
jgi:hypothetical protein